MAGQIEDVHHAFPYGLTFEGLMDGNGLGELGGAAMHVFDSFSELIGFNFGHICRISWVNGGDHAIGG